MSGICGFNWNDKNLIINMIESIKHRGPDGNGYYLDDYLSFGFTHLSINKLTKIVGVPISNEENSILIVFSGELYNRQNIKRKLNEKGYEFSSNLDAEIVLHSFEEYGIDCLSLFNGPFAFCIYDKINNLLFLARDPLGIAPLYYLNEDNRFVFASEIKSILNHEIEREVNRDGLKQYFTFRYTLAPNTLFKKIFKLEAAHYLIYDLKTNILTLKNYFNFEIPKARNYLFNDSPKILAKLVINSLKLRINSDIPVASLLSGGIDSSILTGLTSKINPDLNTFSVGFETSSELDFARLVAEFFNTNHHELIITNETVLSNMDKMISYLEEPVGDPGFFPTLLLCEFASKHNKIVLGGDGADEIFGGYDKYKLYFYGKRISYIMPKFKFWEKFDILSRLAKYSKLSDSQGYLETIRVFNHTELDRLGMENKEIDRYWLKRGNTYQKMQYFDIKTCMPEDFFMEADRMGAPFGIVKRMPYMDKTLVEFALNLPTNLKLHFWNEKFLLKRTFTNLLPKEIPKRRKRGFSVPMDYWFKTILDYQLIEVLKENRHGIYNYDYVLNLLQKMKKSGENYKKNFYLAQKLWTIYLFEEWYRKFII